MGLVDFATYNLAQSVEQLASEEECTSPLKSAREPVIQTDQPLDLGLWGPAWPTPVPRPTT
jgi:hypothetical protein